MSEKISTEKSKRGGKREGAGRPPGVPNKISGTVKENIIDVFNKLGGVDRMTEWAMESPTQFYALYAKLLPTQVESDLHVSGALDIRNIVVNGVKANG